MNTPEFGEALRAIDFLAPSDMSDTLASMARQAGAADLVIYLADFEQTMLYPVPDRGVHVELPVGVAVTGTKAGRSFAERRVVDEQADEAGTRYWVPIVEGSECTGVLGLTMRDDGNDATQRQVAELGMLAGAVISITARQTDLFNMVRRRRSMSLPASLQWDLLPPLQIRTPEGRSTGLLEPAYDVGGDSFDHAVNGFVLDVAIMDAMGHGIDSSLTSALAVGRYRYDRRQGRALAVMHEGLNETLADRFGGHVFVTGQLARLDLRNGRLAWTNAGHPLPLLVRAGRVTRQLDCRPSLPWGLGGALVEEVEVELEPGDTVVFYSDGVVDGRAADGSPFGIDRFVHLVEEAVNARAVPDLVLRHAVQQVADFQSNRLQDDATIVLLEWRPGP